MMRFVFSVLIAVALIFAKGNVMTGIVAGLIVFYIAGTFTHDGRFEPSSGADLDGAARVGKYCPLFP